MSSTSQNQICPFELRNRNPVNKLINLDFVRQIFQKFQIDHQPTDLALYQQAFVHKTYLKPTEDQLKAEDPLNPEEQYIPPDFDQWVPLQPESYEVLEFKGDDILSAIITADLITERYPEQNEGFMTKLKTQLVRGTNLAVLSKELGFGQYILVSRKYEEKGRKSDAVLEDVFEAFLGATYTDFKRSQNVGVAYQICHQLVLGLIERYINMNQMARRQDNYKDQLLQFFHREFNGTNPKYTLISTYGPTNDRIFKSGALSPEGVIIGVGTGAKITDAEQMASKEALKYYHQEIYDDQEESSRDLYSNTKTNSESSP